MSEIGVFANDPGGHSGLAWGIFDPHRTGGVGEALKERTHAGSTTVGGGPREQIVEIATLWQSFYRACVHDKGLSPSDVWFVCENYVLKPGETVGGGDTSISTSIIWGVEGYRMGRADEWREHKRGQIVMPSLILQMAGQAKAYATGPNLKRWGVWTVGREHERSAWAHIALFLNRYREQFPN